MDIEVGGDNREKIEKREKGTQFSASSAAPRFSSSSRGRVQGLASRLNTRMLPQDFPVRRLHLGRTVTTKINIAEIIGEYEHHIGLSLRKRS